MNIRSSRVLLLAAAWGAMELTACASISSVADRISLNPNDQLNWSIAGPSGSIVASGSSFQTTAGNRVEVSSATGGDMRRLDQGRFGGWYGNFEEGSPLLYSGGSGAIEINPDVLFQGAGLQVQSDYFGPFSAELTAYGVDGNILGSVTGNGVSSSGSSGRSLFLGFLSDAFDVDKFVLRLTSAVRFTDRFALDPISFLSAPRREPEFGAPVPESRSGALVGGVALLILGVWRRLQRRSE